MKKRILSLMLAPALLFSMAVPGMTVERSDSADRLAAVTRKVKDTLNLDTEQYKDFHGQLTEGELAPTWRLSWSGVGGSLEITASESGKILSYYFYSEDEDRSGEPLSLPKGDPARVKAAASAFLSRVLDSRETVDLDADGDTTSSLRQTRCYFQGTVLLNGCPSPLSYTLSVRTSDYAVVQFRRDALETDYIGSLPAAGFRMEQSAVEPLLRDTLSLRLEYVLDEEAEKAVLRYLPNGIDSFYVDDASGRLVNLTELYEELGKSGGSDFAEDRAESAPTAAANNAGGLTQAEQLGTDKLKGTLSKEVLDQKARAISQLGLSSYTLATVSYREEELVKDAPVISARLSYAKRVEEETCRRMVTVDAKTGELLGVYSYRPWSQENEQKVSEETARRTAEAFLQAQQRTRFALCAAYTGDPAYVRENGRYGTWSFRYARQEGGYFFPQDQFSVGVDTIDGSIASYSQTWSEDMQFDSPEGIISMEEAVGAYFQTFRVTGGYIAVPQKLDLSDPEHMPLAEMGYSALNCLKLGWQLTAAEERVTGIDAKTGQPVRWQSVSRSPVEYSDLEGSPVREAAQALAEYGIGYAGGQLRPEQELTQLDLMSLLASTQGTLTDPENLEDNADQIYRIAYSIGALRREERNDGQRQTRMDVVKVLLNAGGYGPAARLQGIYRTSFSDEESIPVQLLGYAALAQAMNVVAGDTFAPGQTATRGDAIMMLYAFMQRN